MMKRRYNPHFLPDWLRKPRFYCKHICIPVTCFQLLRTLFVPTTGDFLLLLVLVGICFMFHHDVI